ncbi:SPRY domain-containing SOCS box protein 4-like isoform X1 [Cyprinus carpio]|uniref:SPRY domain-containing SOCS box protein 4-like isoform X1 n=5 Tax=Cyprinidae TaxID=7953 RepID=A0A9Q9W0M4_CYPCA|nr:SPRY domain-containing SOCS box protein 4-like isoform X1 [Cyprinus carpio]XP_042574651.1 SPRY domain-containing SOCS box protein 4-like isoform X1 [Cyprinus carpio]XP_042574652.1 SPRY domain-containing SOCS box protein 4-like isoform X1 [Cyprinus carpio]XP_042574653.1 SPRY domain-containing SOCS box protein 4-like isoform X1 [Cyprinus carpio]XP_042574654.1 SPRY domain-containing SOCS box protein 4-like isoform X1 [Cyprinus carpio]
MGQKISGSIKSVDVRGEPSYRPLRRELRGPDFFKPARLDLLLDMPPAPYEQQLRHAWNPDDRSLNIFIKDDDKLTFHRHPVAQSTDGIRGRVGYTRGLHVWRIHWPARQRGTHAVVGVATADAPLHSVGYTSLVGSDSESWGWDLGRNKLYHNSKNRPASSAPTYPSFLEPEEAFVLPDALMVVLDMDEGTLSFMVDGQYLGVAFRGLKGKKLYPIVSAVWGHCEITMRYINGLDRTRFSSVPHPQASTSISCRPSDSPCATALSAPPRVLNASLPRIVLPTELFPVRFCPTISNRRGGATWSLPVGR